MPSDKEIKQDILRKASREPEKYYPAELLGEMGFERRVCRFCGKGFWSKEERGHCDEPECRMKAGELPYGFIGRGSEMSYHEAWERWKKIFSENGHTVIPRYPVVARWRDDVEFVQASIYDFQPHVVSGEVDPPANPLLVPQVCLRFNDVENVGLSGRHYSSFVMVGQHAFNYPDKWVYFKDRGLWFIHEFLEKGLGLSDGEIVFHEDAWAGGGNFGVSMEFFSQGLEIGNQVYMEYQLTPSGIRELPIKVIDMGAGLERHPWIVSGKPTSYEIVFRHSFRKASGELGVEYDRDFWAEFGKYAGILNVDEKSLEESWRAISDFTGFSKDDIIRTMRPVANLFAVLDHLRTVWFGINDGALPSNTGGGYNLRFLLRRAMNIMRRNRWEMSLSDVLHLLRHDVEKMFPELVESEDLASDVLDSEEKKYEKVLEKGRRIVLKYLGKERITASDLKTLYESHGILPEIVREMAPPGKEIDTAGFYSSLSEERKDKPAKAMPDVSGYPETERLFYESDECEAVFLGSISDGDSWWAVFDRTVFYPEMGGQEADRGKIDGVDVIDVQKAGNVILHKVKQVPWKKGDKVVMAVDAERRKRLSTHHTATHIVGLAARRVFGKHIYQAGTHKYPDRAYLDVSHYRDITDEEVEEIERIANDVVNQDVPVRAEWLPRTEAEQKYGMRIYQGGAPPGRVLRIVSILEDHQACGGIHLKSTGEARRIIITSVRKIQDSRYRIEYVAGDAADEFEQRIDRIIEEIRGIDPEPETIQERWKKKKKEWEKFLMEYGKSISDSQDTVIVRYLPVSGRDLEEISRQISGDMVVVLFSRDMSFLVHEPSGKAKEVASAIHEMLGGKSGGTDVFVRGRVERLNHGMLGDIYGKIKEIKGAG